MVQISRRSFIKTGRMATMIRCGNRELVLVNKSSVQVPVMLAEDTGEETSYTAGMHLIDYSVQLAR